MIEKYIKQLESGFETLRAELERLKLVEAERDQLLAERKEMLVNKVFDSSDKKLLENHGFTDFIELLSAYENLVEELNFAKLRIETDAQHSDLSKSHGVPDWYSHNWSAVVFCNGKWYGVCDGFVFNPVEDFKGFPTFNLPREKGAFICHGTYDGDWKQSFTKRPLEFFAEQSVFAVIAKYPDKKEPVILSWKDMEDGEHRLYARPISGQQLDHASYIAEREQWIAQQGLAVFYGKMPESNGKSNWTAILYRKSEDGLLGGIADGITIDRSEYPDRVRYEADCVRYLIGEIDKKPNILEYDSELHSGYVDPLEVQRMKQSATPIPIEELERVLGPDREKYGFTSIKGEGYELVIDDNRSVRGYPTSIGGVYFIFRNHDIEKHVPLSDEAIDAVLRIRTALEKGSEAEQFMFELL